MPPQEDGVRFENQGEEFGAPPQRQGGFDLTGKLVEWGLASSAEQAQYVLIAVGVLALLVAGYLFFSSGASTPPPPPVS